MSFVIADAKTLFPDSENTKSEVELGVEGIQRLCPTGIWDHWTFRDIMFDRDSNTVLLVIQLNSWKKGMKKKLRKQRRLKFNNKPNGLLPISKRVMKN